MLKGWKIPHLLPVQLLSADKEYNSEQKLTMEIFKTETDFFLKFASAWVGAPNGNCFVNVIPTESDSKCLT